MAKYILLIIGCLAGAFTGYSQNEEPSTADLMAWNPFYEIAWNDFQGKPTSASIGDAGTWVFISAKPYLVRKQVKYDVTAYFNKQKSWSRDQSEALLAHEQLHFDIAELYARKVRKKIAEFGEMKKRDLSLYNSAINKILAESNEADRRYDIETLHGAMLKRQKDWEEQVRDELQALNAYQKSKNLVSN